MMLYTTALSVTPDTFAALIQGLVGDADAMPFYMFNPALEWLLIPLLVLLGWPLSRLRRLVVAVLVVFVIQRVWTYVGSFRRSPSGTRPPLRFTPAQLDDARLWTALSWVRIAVDLMVMAFVLVAAMTHRSGEHKRAELLTSS